MFLHGEDNVISRHLPIAPVKLDPLLEIERPRGTVRGHRPRLGEPRGKISATFQCDESLTGPCSPTQHQNMALGLMGMGTVAPQQWNAYVQGTPRSRFCRGAVFTGGAVFADGAGERNGSHQRERQCHQH